MSTTRIATATDAELIAACAEVIDVPKAAEPNSFLLHAPLELLARAVLLERVPAEARPRACARIEWLAGPLRGMHVETARGILLRVAAQSMLQDNRKAAPYGWTHCLTMPQAVLIAAEHGADPEVAVAVAATYVLGFRSTLGRVRIDRAWTPSTGTAADRAWSMPEDALASMIDELVAYGAVHPDAHVA